MLAVMEFFSQNMIWIGLILLSPILYRFAYAMTLCLYAQFGDSQKDIVIKHFHNGKLVSETIIKADSSQPLLVKKNTE